MSLLTSLASVLVVLVGITVQEQPRKVRKQETRVIALKSDETPPAQVLRVAPDAATLVMFDSPVVRESVDIDALSRFFSRIEVNERSLVLKPAAELPANTAPRLTVRFAGGPPARQMELVLTSHPDEVDTQVEVRHEEEPEARLLAELTELRGRCAATEAGLAPLRARCARAGLAGLFVSGEMDPENGVRAYRSDERAVEQGITPLKRVTLFRTADTVMVGMRMENPSGGAPWVASPARLVRLDARGEPLGEARLLPVVMEPERLAPGDSARVAVQWEEPSEAPASAVRLEVVAADGRGLKWERLELQPPVEDVPRAPRGRKEGRP
ncbi:DUF2381 family protein [Pyxidicoccus fallax]|uniref:DUF2381 family protein n=1 Tax=Pyxidicoccus fallax TaxID=394095 RepID=A0A848L7H9_9BACT|nr:DUF2381 family protein [Pyxidicoccus fallax]NMO14526.1 DUF2381 family protein [Pyxidicoccus fallax]NPC77045.1 DUF2381 family protein [Pyxidicoccus fallax]